MENRIALVTGSGIGRAMAVSLAREGAAVVADPDVGGSEGTVRRTEVNT